MKRLSLGIAVASFVAWLSVPAVEARLPGTLNFTNVTTGNVNQTVVETAPIEKEVEYGDFDNDGDLDVVIACAFSDFGTKRNKLYRNDDGEFNEISTTAFITGAGFGPGFTAADVSRNAFFRDYDNDGWLDFVIINDSNTGGDPGRTKIYMNIHTETEFTGFREEGAGNVDRFPANIGGPACSGQSQDFDNDGDYDVYSANYPNSSQDRMFFNNGSGFFTAVTSTHVPTDGDYTVDAAAADLNGDDTLDLILSSQGSANKIYYNTLSTPNNGPGDFSTTNSTVTLGDAGNDEHATEPGDFDNDGLMDYYWSNRVAGISTQDRIRRNTGNDAFGRAIFVDVASLPPHVTGVHTLKATVNDFNKDGRLDVFVMSDVARPAVLRNTTHAVGQISFIDWTPGNTFATGTTLTGWHAAAFDRGTDGYDDLFVGAFTNQDHLFDNTDSNELSEITLPDGGGAGEKALPVFFNQAPLAITGSVNASLPDVYESPSLTGGSNSFLSVVLNGLGDYRLEILDVNDAVVTGGNINRGGLQVEEAVQVQVSSTSVRKARVTLLQAFGDGDLDQDFDLADGALWFNCYSGDGVDATGPNCDRFDADLDGDVDASDYALSTSLILGPGVPAIGTYQLELLARN